jgi:4-amino-4-deoxy-L-arabinose transferase-like glycosyltransferase
MSRLFFPILLLTIFFAFFRLGSVTLFDVDEAVFSEATKEMVESGNWITPTYNGENRYDKPILLYWLMAGSYKIFGVNEFGARFPSAVASCLLICSLFFFVKHFQDDVTALYAAISSVLSLSFFVYSHAAVTDMLLTLFITLSLFSFYCSVAGNEKYPGRETMYSFGFYLFSALAFLTKGLIGIVFPFGVALIYMIATERWGGVRKVFRLKGLILFLLVSAPWYLAQFSINGWVFFDQFIVRHHLKRYTGVISGHKGPFYYYIPVLLIGLFPWIAYIPAGIRNTLKGKEKFYLFALLWVAFLFVFFSLSTTKLPNYILPATPAASLLIASGMKFQTKRWWQFSHFFMAGMALLTGVAFLLSRQYLVKFGVDDFAWLYLLVAILVGIAALGVYSALTKKGHCIVLSGLMILFLSILSIKVMPLISGYLQGTLHKYSLYAKERLSPDEDIFVYGINNPSIVFYSGHNVIPLKGQDSLIRLGDEGHHSLVIAKTKNIDILKNRGFRVLENDDRYAILERE